MLNFSDVLETVNMIENEHLDVRTITMGISLLNCVSDDENVLFKKVYDKITKYAENLVSVGSEIEKEYGIPIINKRISLTPAAIIGGSLDSDGYVRLAKTLDKAAKAVGEKSVAMIKAKELLPLTGYVHGGCSPIGMKKQFKTTIHKTASDFDTIYFSAGKIGYQVQTSLKELEKIISFELDDITE